MLENLLISVHFFNIPYQISWAFSVELYPALLMNGLILLLQGIFQGIL